MDEQNGFRKVSCVLLLFILSCSYNTVTFDNEASFQIELAETIEERERGLMNREELDDERGMLFIFPDEQMRTFWMKNTKIALDIIFLDENMTVVNVFEAEPCTIDPCQTYSATAKYVLEINKGLAKEKAISSGSRAWIIN